MEGTIANTDLDWYRFLAGLQAERGLDEVNFWQPSGGRTFRGAPGSPFFFKLKQPHDAIAGFGVVARAEILPDWLAWECFGPKNGAPDFDSMRARLAVYRARSQARSGPVARVGCIVLVEPVFFREKDWVRQPADWKPNIVTHARYDLSRGEGERILRECQERVLAQALSVPDVVRETVEQLRRGVLVVPRLGQGGFRLAVKDAYGAACAVTGEHSLPALEAAHIVPFARERRHEIANGILLRGDVHRLFDTGYVSVDPEGRFHVSPRLKDEWRNGRSYYPLDGQPIRLPADRRHQPDRARLRWHFENVYLG